MEITKREILASVTIVAVMMILGFVIDGLMLIKYKKILSIIQRYKSLTLNSFSMEWRPLWGMRSYMEPWKR